MTLRVLFFSVLQDLTGTPEAIFDCSEGSSAQDLLNLLFEKWPAMRAWDASLLIAADHAYIKRDTPLRPGQEIAIMPPVQGG